MSTARRAPGRGEATGQSIGQTASLRSALNLFRDPVTAEKRALLRARWSGLAPSLREVGQGLGQKATGCGATVGIQPRCDFACTGCYLGSEANRIPAMPTVAVLAQLDALRGYLGPKSNVQVTDGEVTLRPIAELLAIFRHARSIGVIPMMMTHGDNLRRQPGLLERLMVEGGLSEVSIHVDITQRGRDGHRAPRSEVELMALRDEFADMVRAARRRTGRALRAAMTLTVTAENLPQIADVVRWTIENRDAFSLLSFQPLAQVGRTRKELQGVDANSLWREVARGVADFGAGDLMDGAGPLHFGHSECTRFVPLLAIERRSQGNRPDRPQLLQLIRDRPEDLAILAEFWRRGLGGVAFRDDRPLEKIGRGAGMLRAAPGWLLGGARRWVDRLLREEAGTSLAKLALDVLRKRVRVDGITLTSHHFMSPEELGTEVGKARLDACVFRLPYRGEMVPMCKMNAGGLREELYAELAAARS